MEENWVHHNSVTDFKKIYSEQNGLAEQIAKMYWCDEIAKRICIMDDIQRTIYQNID